MLFQNFSIIEVVVKELHLSKVEEVPSRLSIKSD
jgi:hypothetical protein